MSKNNFRVCAKARRSVFAYCDQLEPLEIITSAETTEGLLYAGRTDTVGYVD